MANIADKVQQIREAVYGREVRESIASGIEAINSEVVSTTERQNKIDEQEQSRINAEAERQSQESIRQSNESKRQKTFEINEGDRQSTFDVNESKRQNVFESNETGRQNVFESNENRRGEIFSQNENEREDFFIMFKQWYESTQMVGRLPIFFDGGYFGLDESNDNIIDCGYFGN